MLPNNVRLRAFVISGNINCNCSLFLVRLPENWWIRTTPRSAWSLTTAAVRATTAQSDNHDSLPSVMLATVRTLEATWASWTMIWCFLLQSLQQICFPAERKKFMSFIVVCLSGSFSPSTSSTALTILWLVSQQTELSKNTMFCVKTRNCLYDVMWRPVAALQLN